jgi:hypothetical protein
VAAEVSAPSRHGPCLHSPAVFSLAPPCQSSQLSSFNSYRLKVFITKLLLRSRALYMMSSPEGFPLPLEPEPEPAPPSPRAAPSPLSSLPIHMSDAGPHHRLLPFTEVRESTS